MPPALGQTRCFSALSHAFVVRSADPGLLRHVEDTLEPLGTAPCRPSGSYDFTTAEAPGPGCRLRFGGEELAAAGTTEALLPAFFQHVNRSAVRATTTRLLFHSAALEGDGSAVLLVGRGGAGKTTLAAGLFRAGLRYLTDDVVAIDPGSLLVMPYHRPIALRAGSWGLFPEWHGLLSSGRAGTNPARCYINPRWIRPDGLASGPAPPGVIVFVEHRAGQATALLPVGRSRSVILLHDQFLNRMAFPGEWLHLLAAVVAGAECYRLTAGDLTTACDEVLTVLG